MNPGRPSKGLTATLIIRCTPLEKRAWELAAEAAGKNLSEWLRGIATEAVLKKTGG